MKTLILIESLGIYARLTLSPELQGSEIERNRFENLLWAAGATDRENAEPVAIVNKKKLATAVKAWRSPRRFTTKNADRNAPYEFRCVEQRTDSRQLATSPYGIGGYQDAEPGPFEGFKSRLAA